MTEHPPVAYQIADSLMPNIRRYPIGKLRSRFASEDHKARVIKHKLDNALRSCRLGKRKHRCIEQALTFPVLVIYALSHIWDGGNIALVFINEYDWLLLDRDTMNIVDPIALGPIGVSQPMLNVDDFL